MFIIGNGWSSFIKSVLHSQAISVFLFVVLAATFAINRRSATREYEPSAHPTVRLKRVMIIVNGEYMTQWFGGHVMPQWHGSRWWIALMLTREENYTAQKIYLACFHQMVVRDTEDTSDIITLALWKYSFVFIFSSS